MSRVLAVEARIISGTTAVIMETSMGGREGRRLEGREEGKRKEVRRDMEWERKE